ncbi:glucose dehydrogenase [FAD, quinone]-like isoform X2 [Venturia canescens]|uniref:glucose dehydrogenase [FAD, quinone]-like isoform X2 n=1 Tax=Venturia canescens TaxID=32260 RepID=UPI001C9C404A|nr:glucose dehydrogenase [FAD, quinone]-like isoform X2 [Venturia canescens]
MYQSSWPQGKVFGGSSRLNYMAYVPGHPKDYAWFPDYADYILKAEDGIVEEPQWDTNLSEIIWEAVNEIIPHRQSDFGRVRLTIKDGERSSVDRALKKKLQNGLNVLTHSFVNKIIFDEDTARGIQFIKWGAEFRVYAKKGVIVSAGAIGSPKLLMLSGVGPKDHLESLAIKVIKDLPVGQNLVDHILTGIDLVMLNISLPLNVQSVLNPIAALNYFIFRQGPWTSAGIEAVGTFYSPNQNHETDAPDLQLMVIPLGVSQDNGIVLRKAMGISDRIFEQYFGPLIVQTSITIAPVLLHPKSSGEIRLASSNPFDYPLIDPKYLTHKDDVTTLLSGLKLVKQLIKSEKMKKIGASLYEAVFPGCENFIFDSDEYWECYIRHLTLTSYHPAGTCRIGSVVDNFFRVYNTTNLYVVDASVLPELPSGNINAAVMMLAKRAAKFLKHRHKSNTIEVANCTKFVSYLRALYGSRTEMISKHLLYVGVQPLMNE